MDLWSEVTIVAHISHINRDGCCLMSPQIHPVSTTEKHVQMNLHNQMQVCFVRALIVLA